MENEIKPILMNTVFLSVVASRHFAFTYGTLPFPLTPMGPRS